MQTVADRASADHLTRSFDFTECELRDNGPDGFLTFEGIASVVDKPYTVRDMFGEFSETIVAGAFDKTLAELGKRAAKGPQHDVALYVNHDYRSVPLASVSSGLLELSVTPDLAVRAHLNPARPDVQIVRHAVADGVARQMSIGFSVPKGKGKDVWNEDYSERSIHELRLGEASIVWQGANHHTVGAMRSAESLMVLIESGEYDEDEVRRLIAALDQRIPKTSVETPAHVLEQIASLQQLWEARKPA